MGVMAGVNTSFADVGVQRGRRVGAGRRRRSALERGRYRRRGLYRATAIQNGGKGEEAGEAWRGHGCPVPLHGGMRPSAWALKRRPYNGEGRTPPRCARHIGKVKNKVKGAGLKTAAT